MAIHDTTQWELRGSGDDDNGAGFADLDPGTSIDYTQQDAAQQSFVDLAMVTGGTTLTSASNNFTAAMVGNCIYIKTGTNFTAGYYQITSFNGVGSVEIDRDATNGANASNGNGKVGGGREHISDNFFQKVIVAGNTVWLAWEVVSTITHLYIDNGGTPDKYIKVYGYNTTHGDEPVGDDRPWISAWGDRFQIGDTGYGYWDFRHIRFWVNYAFGVEIAAADSVFINCLFFNNGSLGCCGLHTDGAGTRLIDCSSYPTTGRHGICAGFISQDHILDQCYVESYAYDGIDFIDECSSLFDCISYGNNENFIGAWGYVKGCTFYKNFGTGNKTGLTFFDAGVWSWVVVLNCIFNELEVGFVDSDSSNWSYFDFNDWYGNDRDLSFLNPDMKGENALAVTPDFINPNSDVGTPLSDDYRLKYTSGLLNAGLTLEP